MARSILIDMVLATALWGALPMALAADPFSDLEDPMRPYNAPAERPTASAAPTVFRLQSVVSGPENRAALINGRLVREGDRINGALVKTIEGNRVTIEVGSEPVILLMGTGKKSVTLRREPDVSVDK